MHGGVGAVTNVLRSPQLRRLEMAFCAFSFSEHATWLAVLVFALREGGTRTVGVVAAVQLLPGVLLAPFAAYAGDRFPPHRALALGYAMQCLSMAVTAIAMARGEPLAVLLAATVAATCMTFTRPVMRSLIPNVTRTPAELVAANSVTSSIEQVGMLVGPLAAGAVIAWRSPATMFALAAATTAAALVITLMTTADLPANDESAVEARDVIRQAFSGFEALRSNRPLRVLVGLGMCAGIARGVGDVTFVTFAAERLGGRGWQAGLLGGAYGLGALGGAIAVTGLVRSRRVSKPMIGCAVALGASLLVLARAEGWPISLLAFMVFGGSEVLLELLSATTIQRIAPGATLSRVFGVLEGLLMATTALGAFTIATLTARRSLTAALVVAGLALMAFTITGIALLQRASGDVEPPDDEIVDRLITDELFLDLPAPAIERLARTCQRVRFAEGTPVVTQGELGDRYYLVIKGIVDVTIDGEHIRFMGTSGSFGSIALLRNVPRTATVTAVSPLELLAIERDDFLEVVTGHPRTWVRADAAVDAFDR
jgi:Na+/melibiose symporter-like transporter